MTVRTTWHDESFKARLNSEINSALIDATESVKDMAQDNAPVRTGYLRDSIVAEIFDNGESKIGSILAQAKYAFFVEKGTRKMSAQPFLLPALYSKWNSILRRFTKLF